MAYSASCMTCALRMAACKCILEHGARGARCNVLLNAWRPPCSVRPHQHSRHGHELQIAHVADLKRYSPTNRKLTGNHMLAMLQRSGSSFTAPLNSAPFTSATASEQWNSSIELEHLKPKLDSACLFSRMSAEDVPTYIVAGSAKLARLSAGRPCRGDRGLSSGFVGSAEGWAASASAPPRAELGAAGAIVAASTRRAGIATRAPCATARRERSVTAAYSAAPYAVRATPSTATATDTDTDTAPAAAAAAAVAAAAADFGSARPVLD
eukprot:359501-Chlamydomonas_euryale.AAC.6